jgi:outer membrane protein
MKESAMRSFPTRAWWLMFPLLTAAAASGQSGLQVGPAQGSVDWLTRPYRAPYVPPVRLTNSVRLDTLIQAGSLYLTAADVVALAIENNIDIEVQRYAPLLSAEVLRRARAGGALRSVGLGVAAGPQSVSISGVSVNTSGGVSASTGGGVSSGGGIVTQLGPSIPTLDPTLLLTSSFGHTTSPQSNTVLTGTTALTMTTRAYSAFYSQNWDFGLSAQLAYQSQTAKLNSRYYSLNPYTSGSLDLQVTQNLLQGFGRAVNGRNIRVQKNNVKVSQLQFEQQVATTVSAVLNLYWDLVALREELRAREQGVAMARQLVEDNKKKVEAGVLAEIEITRAESQFYSSQQDLVIARTNLLQQETILKNALCRDGIAGAGLTGVRVIPLDSISVPDKDQAAPLEELIQSAVANRTETAQSRINIESNKMNLVGIRNSLKPTLQAFSELTNNALTGDLAAAASAQAGIGYMAGGYGNLLAQMFRRNFPSYSAGVSLSISFRNRAAQSDYVTSMLELRQNELNLRKSVNQVRVDVQNAVIGLEQARVRYGAASKSRALAEQTLAGDQERYRLGALAAFQVIQDQRDLANTRSTEVQAMANYMHARISLDQALGTTLSVNRIATGDALNRNAAHVSKLPAELPKGERP